MFDRGPHGPDGPDGPVLGIDPGISRCGYGVVQRGERGPEPLAFGVVRTPRERPLPERLALLEDELDGIVGEVRPRAVAVERVLFQTNARTAISVGQASGVALVVAARHGVGVAYYSPNEVKLAVAGHGAAEKAAVQTMVARLLRLSSPPRPPDAADALALALTHLWGARLGALVPETDADESAPTGTVPGLAEAVDAALARDAARETLRGAR